MRITLILAFALMLAAPAWGETILLAEFGWSQPEPVTLPAEYIFAAKGNLPDNNFAQGGWNAVVTEFGTTTASAPIVAMLEFALTHSATGLDVAFHNAGQNRGPMATFVDLDVVLGGTDRDWSNGGAEGLFGYHGTAHVPQLGEGFFGYTISAIERVVSPESQTIRLFGERWLAIPEPASWLLVMMCGCALHLSRLAPQLMWSRR